MKRMGQFFLFCYVLGWMSLGKVYAQAASQPTSQPTWQAASQPALHHKIHRLVTRAKQGLISMEQAAAQAEALGVHLETATPVLLRYLKAPSWRVRALALTLLTQGPAVGLAAQHAVMTILKNDEAPTIRAVAALFLGKDGCRLRLVIPALKQALHDKHFLVRISATTTLNKIYTRTQSIPLALVRLLDDNYPLVQFIAAKSLGQMALKGSPVLPALANALKKKLSKGVKVTIIETLAASPLNTPQLRSALLGALKDKHWVVRHAAVRALGAKKSSAIWSRDPLLAALTDRSPIIRSAVIWALAKLSARDPETRRVLVEKMQHGSTETKMDLVSAVSTSGASAAWIQLILRKGLNSGHVLVEYATVRALEKAPLPIALPVLVDALQLARAAPRKKAFQILKSLGARAAPAIPALQSAQKDVTRKKYATLALQIIHQHLPQASSRPSAVSRPTSQPTQP